MGRYTREQLEEIRLDELADAPRLDEVARRELGKSVEIGARLRALRGSCGLSLGELASASGMDKAHLSRLENGHRRPSFETIEKYAAALGKRVELVFVDAA